MTENNSIVTATFKDATTLTTLSIQTFLETFSADNKKEDMDKYIAEEMGLQQLTDELNDLGNTFFIAYRDGTAIGYAKMRTTKIPAGLEDSNPIELERIYVLKEYLGSKAGAALLQHCIDHAISLDKEVLWLGVWEHNHRAVSFYKRWGFERFGSHIFRLGHDEQTDVLMKKVLTKK